MIHVETLDCKIRVVYEYLPYLRSVSAGVWIGSGSRNESEDYWGVSHFLEHMLFKGTKRRSAKEIAEEIDHIGGQINAFTARDCTCFYTKTLDTHLDIALDILSDMLKFPKLSPKDIELERGVVLEEINMYEDTPDELVHDLLAELCYRSHPIGRSILGSPHSLETLTSKKVRHYLETHYTGENIVISIVGNFDPKTIVDQVRRYFCPWPYQKAERLVDQAPIYHPGSEVRKKKIEQAHLCIAFPGLVHSDPEVYTLSLINTILGGGMSSRLFQHIREEKGLAYSVYSYPTVFEDTGYFTIYAGCSTENLEQVAEMILEEIRVLKRELIPESLLSRTKEQLKGNYILASENTSSRMISAGKQLLLYDRILTETDIINMVDAIDMRSVEKVIEKVFDFSQIASMAVVPES